MKLRGGMPTGPFSGKWKVRVESEDEWTASELPQSSRNVEVSLEEARQGGGRKKIDTRSFLRCGEIEAK